MDVSSSPAPQPKAPPSAVWSLVFGILSIGCLWILGSIPAIVLGIVAIKKSGNAPDQYGGKGLALGGIITGGIGVILGLIPWAIVSAVAIPAIMKTEEVTAIANDRTEIRQLVLACRMYATDNEGKFPPTLEELFPDYIEDRELLTAEISTNPRVVQPYLYRPGLTEMSELDEIVLAGPIRGSAGRRVVGRVDGTTESNALPLDSAFPKETE